MLTARPLPLQKHNKNSQTIMLIIDYLEPFNEQSLIVSSNLEAQLTLIFFPIKNQTGVSFS